MALFLRLNEILQKNIYSTFYQIKTTALDRMWQLRSGNVSFGGPPTFRSSGISFEQGAVEIQESGSDTPTTVLRHSRQYSMHEEEDDQRVRRVVRSQVVHF